MENVKVIEITTLPNWWSIVAQPISW